MEASESAASIVNDKVKLRRTVNLFSAIAMTIGTIIGSGIYISPKGVLMYTGSLGLNLIIWVLCGMISMGGAFCFAELGTLIPESGGQWVYIRTGLGDAPAFIAAWMNVILTSTSMATLALASSGYLLSNFFGACGIPLAIEKMSGVVVLWMALYISSSVKLATRVMKVLFFMKIISLILIIIGGVYWMIRNGSSNLHAGFEGTTNKPWNVALSFYSGLWAYEGWDAVSFITEEVKDVKRTIPRAIIGSIIMVTCLYLLVNVSYLSVLTSQQLLESPAVAVDWGSKLIGEWSRLFSVVVSLSIFGSAVATLFGTSRVLMAVARQGHTLELLSMVSVLDNSPLLSIIVRGAAGTIFTLVGDINTLVDVFGFCSWTFYAMTFTSLIILKLRKYKKDNNDVFRVNIVLPFVMLAVAIYLVIVPIVADPRLPYLFAALFMISGLIFYFPFVYCKVRVHWFDRITVFMQLLFKVSLPDKDI